MIRGLVVVALVGVAFAVWADLAAACSCADVDERDRLESGEIELRLVDFGACGNPVVGLRQGIFIRRRSGGWSSDGCSIVKGSALERALRPYRRPTGPGRVALLAAGSFGNARLMALDAQGRVLGYGFGEGETRAVSVCPGALRSPELVVGRRAVSVAVRDLGTLDLVRSATLPVRTRRLDIGRTIPLHCADADGTAHVAVGDYIRRTRFERMRIFRVDAGGARRVATLEGSNAALGPGTGTSAATARRSWGWTSPPARPGAWPPGAGPIPSA